MPIDLRVMLLEAKLLSYDLQALNGSLMLERITSDYKQLFQEILNEVIIDFCSLLNLFLLLVFLSILAEAITAYYAINFIVSGCFRSKHLPEIS